MKINSNAMVSITEANQNFSKVARLADQHGSVVILKNNSPRYVLTKFDRAEKAAALSDCGGADGFREPQRPSARQASPTDPAAGRTGSGNRRDEARG